MTTVSILSHGDMLPMGRLTLHSRFHNVINYTRGDELVTLGDSTLQPGPCSIILGAPPQEGVEELEFTKTTMSMGCLKFILTPKTAYDSQINFQIVSQHLLNRNIDLASEHTIAIAPQVSLAFLLESYSLSRYMDSFRQGLETRFRKATKEMDQGNYQECAGMVRGLGIGLTPAGDDLNAGILMGLYLTQIGLNRNLEKIRMEVHDVAKGENLISNSFLKWAFLGRFVGSFKAFVDSLQGNDAAKIFDSINMIAGIGKTSGLDTLTGLLLCLGREIRQ